MIVVYIFIIGLLMGSFFLVIGSRLPLKENVITGRSRCDYCHEPLKWYEIVPIISYVIQLGKCRHCGQKIGIIHLVMEVGTAALYLVGYFYYGLSYDYGIYLSIISALLLIFVSDFKYMVILDSTIIIPTFIVLVFKYLEGGIESLLLSVLSGAFLFILMFVIKLIGDKLFKRESLGGGDIKLCFLIGSTLGFELGLISLIFASFLALPYAVATNNLNKKSELPYGPFLIASCVIVFVFIAKFSTLLELFSLT